MQGLVDFVEPGPFRVEAGKGRLSNSTKLSGRFALCYHGPLMRSGVGILQRLYYRLLQL